jgi:hypothetical protein
VDSRYYIGGREYFAHKLLLARHSGFCRKFFESAEESTAIIQLPLPFGSDESFHSMIDFIYTCHMSGDPRDLGHLISIRSIAAFYDVDILSTISTDLYNRYYRNALETRPPAADILGAFSVLKTYEVRRLPGIENLIDEGIARFTRSQDLYLDLVAKYVNVEHGFISPLVTSYMVAQLLGRQKLPNDKLIRTIEKYVHDQGDQTIDMSPLEPVIEWGNPESLTWFSEYDLRWVSAGRMRQGISQVLDRRRMDWER